MVTAGATSVSTSAFVTGPKAVRAPGQPGVALDGTVASTDEAVAGALVDRASGAESSQEASRSSAAVSSGALTARDMVCTG
jgi:hypothetical protein